MSNYENYITANSTFSWWAAVLNQNKDLIKICPDPYFRNDDGTRNLYDNTWIKISKINLLQIKMEIIELDCF